MLKNALIGDILIIQSARMWPAKLKRKSNRNRTAEQCKIVGIDKEDTKVTNHKP